MGEARNHDFDAFIRDKVIPPFLYRYRSVQSEHFKEDLQSAVRDARVWAHSAFEQNDPFEALPSLSRVPPKDIRDFLGKFFEKYPGYLVTGTLFREELIKKGVKKSAIRKILSPTLESARNFSESAITAMKADRSQYLISSFSSRPDSILMWSHYSDAHKGVCIEFKTQENVPQFNFPAQLSPMQYQNKRPKFTDLDIINYIGWSNFKDEEIFDNKISDRIIFGVHFTKSIDWAYEREWRLGARGDKPKYMKLNPFKVSSVLLGVKSSKKTLSIVRDVCKEFPHVSVRRMKLSQDEFSVDAGPAI